MIFLAINWAEVGVKAGQFILSFSIIVILHELGHFLPARWFKCRVEKFYLFFNPWFSLFKKKIGETEYGLGWVPFGGYVKISGMVDESMDKEQLKQPPKPYEFRSKPAWQRLIIMVGGVIVNLVLGFLIYALMLWYWGESYVPTNKFTYGIATDSIAQSIGLRDGDKILSVDGEYIDRFNKIPLRVILNGAKTFEVERDGKPLTIAIPDHFAADLIHEKAVGFIDMRVPFLGVNTVADTSAAMKAGLRKGDKILAVNNNPVPFFHSFQQQIRRNKEKTVQLQVQRGADTLQLSAAIPKTGVLGITPLPFNDKFEVKEVKYGFLEAIPAGFKKSIETLTSYWLQLKLIFSGKVNTNESLGSVISIGKMFAPVWDWQQFWGLTAFFSLVLALMNILPIPGLDGGHALFTLYEMISGRKPSDKFMEYAQMVGMILLLGLMAYALGLDIFRLFK
ncbi:RIP metalloprotease RseP [Flavihumibacter sp. CACIAM 22H1]|uniref:RIP metalloprotease RseP n=1 Tax=Flavihumibacter sp. CACIAM 22H1 TaxID=1812911 RepID=UPI0007A7F9EA|nr:RIP metalloprotease RseP [Flavihumibacter sp. CACIAM 22H1]KYP13550.1 MAG: RIP metalloprotease RseP [Flavihumibacter sp. CACIAM 22H1]